MNDTECNPQDGKGEERRPGIEAIQAEIRAQYPRMPESEVISLAKQRWHERRRSGQDAIDKGATWI